VAGLGAATGSAETRRTLISLLDQSALRRDALRSLRGAASDAEVEKSLLAWWDRIALPDEERPELAGQLLLALQTSKTAAVEKRRSSLTNLAGPRPSDVAGWQKFLANRGDPVAGERLFFHSQGPRCFVCHRVDGRGGKIGPDLSTIARALSRDRLIESILTPSKEIAPMFVSWNITTRDGKTHVGLVVDEGPHSTITLANAQGQLEVIKRQDVEERVALPTSIMPDKLHEQMTPREFLDLITYLSQRK
jgi:putative heme-binding domain-containing protein